MPWFVPVVGRYGERISVHSEPEGRGAAWTEERATEERATREGGASRAARGERETPSPAASVGLPDLGLGGSVVIVTGAGSGIGAAAARHLAAAGASVVMVGRRTAPLESV